MNSQISAKRTTQEDAPPPSSSPPTMPPPSNPKCFCLPPQHSFVCFALPVIQTNSLFAEHPPRPRRPSGHTGAERPLGQVHCSIACEAHHTVAWALLPIRPETTSPSRIGHFIRYPAQAVCPSVCVTVCVCAVEFWFNIFCFCCCCLFRNCALI